MPTWYYRYISNPAELKQIIDERKVRSLNRQTNYLTWYTPTRYVDVHQAQQELAMPDTPTYRVGPIAETQLGTLHTPLRLSQPAHGCPGGGLEAATYEEVWLFGLWNFHPGRWEL
jgi:hypothetical protein